MHNTHNLYSPHAGDFQDQAARRVFSAKRRAAEMAAATKKQSSLPRQLGFHLPWKIEVLSNRSSRLAQAAGRWLEVGMTHTPASMISKGLSAVNFACVPWVAASRIVESPEAASRRPLHPASFIPRLCCLPDKSASKHDQC